MLEQIMLLVGGTCLRVLKRIRHYEHLAEVLMLFSASSNRDEEKNMQYLVFCEHFRPAASSSPRVPWSDNFYVTIPFQLKEKPTQKWADKGIGKIHPYLGLLVYYSLLRAQAFSLKEKLLLYRFWNKVWKCNPTVSCAAQSVWICRQYNYCWEVAAALAVSHNVPLQRFKASRGSSVSK